MSLIYKVHKVEEERSKQSETWDAVTPLRIEHYLWENNGYRPEVQVRLFYTDEHLHVQFRTYESNPTITYYNMNDEVYKDSCVEFFVQPLPEQDERYLNFEKNAAGTLLLGLGKGRERNRLTDVDPSLFNIQTMLDLKDVQGKTYWQLQYAIPFTFIKEHFPAFEANPGTNLRANFYKCGEEVPEPHYGCWNLIESDQPDFHISTFFGHLEFV